MKARLLLTAVPAALVAVLVQSALWVPTYERQTRGNPGRLDTFVEASSADAKILNPVLHADSASARIVGLVFDPLIDLDENLRRRPRLARAWRLYERAYLAVPPGARLADATPVDADRLRGAVREWISGKATLSQLVESIEVQPARVVERSLTLEGEDGGPVKAEVRMRRPPRLAFRLRKVDPEFFERLRPVLGPRWGEAFDPADRLEVEPARLHSRVAERAHELLALREHNPVLEFELRRGVRFHDGHELDAEDVNFTYRAIVDPRNLSPRASDFEPVKSVEIADTHRVRIVYGRLFSPAVDAWTGIEILPAHLLDRAALEHEMHDRGIDGAARDDFGMRRSRFNRAPVGTGAFRFVEWESDEVVHLASNPDYWDGEPLFEDYYYRVLPDSLAREMEFRAGAVDTYPLQPFQVARFRRDPKYRTISAVGFGYTYIGYNTRRPPLDDPDVRRALGMAIDVEALIRYVLYGEAERTTGPYPKNTEWYDPDVAPLPYDPERALALLESLGWRRNADGWLEKDGRILEFNLITNNGNQVRKAILSIAQNAWRRIGVKCNTQVFEWAVFLEDFVNPGAFDAVVLGWVMGPDPDLHQIWHSSQTGANQLNFVGYQNREADRLIQRIRREYDREEQRRLARTLHRRIAADQPYTFLYARHGTRVLDRKIVMRDEDGGHEPVRPSRSGDVFYHFNRWTKVGRAPEF